MGWETILFTGINFNRETFNSKVEVEEKLQEVHESISFYKEKLHSLVVMTEPQKFCPKDSEPLWWLDQEFQEYYENLHENIIDEYKLSILLDSWEECHMITKDPKTGNNREFGVTTPPELGTPWDKSYIDGDFVDVVWPNGEQVPDEYYQNKEKYRKEHNIVLVDPRKSKWTSDE